MSAIAILGVQAASPDEPPRALLPDLRPVAPFAAEVVRVREKRRVRYLLAFPSVTENVGDGPLHIRARRSSRRQRTMTAAQVVEHTNGSLRRYRRVGKLRFDRERDHSHWHYLRFMVYELRGAETGELIAPDRKSGFCLGDRHRIGDRKISGAARKPLYSGDCGKGKPRLLRIREGISVGWLDNYAAFLEGQYVDISDVAAGRYILVHHTNRARKLRETDYSNNSSSSLIELRTPAGSKRPKVEILERCGDIPRCG